MGPAHSGPLAGFRQGRAVGVVVHFHSHPGEELLQKGFHPKAVEVGQGGAQHHRPFRVPHQRGHPHPHAFQVFPGKGKSLHQLPQGIHRLPEKVLGRQGGVRRVFRLPQQGFVFAENAQGHLGPSNVNASGVVHGFVHHPSFCLMIRAFAGKYNPQAGFFPKGNGKGRVFRFRGLSH